MHNTYEHANNSSADSIVCAAHTWQLGWRSALVALFAISSMALSTCVAAQSTPWVKVIPSSGNLATMFFSCVQHYKTQGLSIQQAIGQCVAIGVIYRSEVTNGGSNTGFVGGKSDSPSVGVDCSHALGPDAKVSSGFVHREADPRKSPSRAPIGALGSYENRVDAFMTLLGDLSWENAQEGMALREQARNTNDPAQKVNLTKKAEMFEDLSSAMFDAQMQEPMKWYFDRMEDYYETKTAGTPPGDYNIPDPNAPTVSRMNPNHVSACETLAAFVNDCELSGWQTSPCQIFLSQLNGCGDPTITDPSPDAQQPCNAQPFGAKETSRLTFVACNDEIKYGPGSDPCTSVVGEGNLYELNFSKLNPNAPPCSNPFAYPTDEPCSPTYAVVVSKRDVAQKAIDEARKRFGGPIFILPMEGPFDPTHSGGCNNDPRCP